MAENLPDTNVGNIEYISKQDAVKECGEWYVEEGPEEGFIGTVSQMLDMFSPADVAPVVRCRDCEAWQTTWNPSIPDRHYCAVMDSMMKADDFCSYGERKE